jgi:hypothetical protein
MYLVFPKMHFTMFNHPDTQKAAAVVQGGLCTAQAGSRPLHHVRDGGFADILNVKHMGL